MYRLVINPQQKEENQIKLTDSQAHYLRRVVRLSDGDGFIALDGEGECWQVRLNPDGGEIIASIKENKELSTKVYLIIALPKGNGLDDVIRCVTELGVAEIFPVTTARTLPKPNDHKLQRWRKIAVEASEQSERQVIPIIHPPQCFDQVINDLKSLDYSKYIASARASAPHLITYLADLPAKIVVAIGCEGGWSDDEVRRAHDCGFQEISLGKRILRAVTAPITVMSLIAGMNEK